MRSLLISTAVAVAVMGAAAPVMAAGSAGYPHEATATSGLTPVAHQRHYVNGRVPRYLRGFDDQWHIPKSFAHHRFPNGGRGK